MALKLLPRTRTGWLRLVLVWGFVMVAAFIWLRRFVEMPGESYRGPLPELAGEVAEEHTEVRRVLEEHVRALANRIGERHTGRPEALEAAADYVEAHLRDCGYVVTVQPYAAAGRTVRNVEASVVGATVPDEIVVIGAHYDTHPGTPGADDNASGVAGLLELARLLKDRRFDRTVRLVAFANEEHPHFRTDSMGSRVYARRCREHGDRIVGAVVLESIGCYSDQPGSQSYPLPLGLLYPDAGDFIGFVGNTRSREFVRRCIASFRRRARFPSEGIAAPVFVPRVGSSDHWSFWQEGYPALMVTDTAPYRYAHYHEPTDTPDRLDYDRMARVVLGVGWVAADLAGMILDDQ